MLRSIARDTGSMLMHAHNRSIDHLHGRIMNSSQRFCLDVRLRGQKADVE